MLTAVQKTALKARSQNRTVTLRRPRNVRVHQARTCPIDPLSLRSKRRRPTPWISPVSLKMGASFKWTARRMILSGRKRQINGDTSDVPVDKEVKREIQ